LSRKGWTLAVVEAGLGGLLIRRLAGAPGPFLGGEMLTEMPTPAELLDVTAAYRQARHAGIGLGVVIYPEHEKQDVHIALITPEGRRQFSRSYGGPPDYAPRWALHHSLDVIRNL